MQKSEIIKGAVMGAAINAIINGLINWFQVKDQSAILLADDRISSTAHTVLSASVPMATLLAFILSSIAYLTWKHSTKPPFLWSGFWLSMKHALVAFGAMVLVGVMTSRLLGEVLVTPIQSALIAGLVAALTAGFVDYLTKIHLLHEAQR